MTICIGLYFKNNSSIITKPQINTFQPTITNKEQKTESDERKVVNTNLKFQLMLPIGMHKGMYTEILFGSYEKCNFSQYVEVNSRMEPITLVNSKLIRNQTNESPAVYSNSYEYPSSPQKTEKYSTYVFKQNGFDSIEMQCFGNYEQYQYLINEVLSNFRFVAN